MFKFLHAADIHLDSPLRGLDKYEGASVDALRGATRRAFTNLVNLAIQERVDFVILAGDIYDGDWRDYNTGLFFVNELRRLDKAGIPVVLLSGNHDAESRITGHLTLPENTRPHLFPTAKSDTVRFDHLRVALHGQGYANQAETRNIASKYPSPIPGYFNIGVLHTALEGREGHKPYAPCTFAELVAFGYDYWALGHVHKRESVNGSAQIRVEYPGNIQGRDVGETGPKGCLLVKVDGRNVARPEFRALDVFRWEEVAVDAINSTTLDDAIEAAVKEVADASAQADGRTLAVRVKVSCNESIHRHITENMERFRFDLAAQVGSDVWIEKIRPKLVVERQREDSNGGGDAGAELRTVLAGLRSNPQSMDSIFASDDCGRLKKALPHELRKSLISAATTFLIWRPCT